MSEDRKTGDGGEVIGDQTKVTLQLVIAIVAGVLALAGTYFKMQGDMAVLELRTSARIEALEQRTDRQVVLLCAIAKKLSVESGECR